MRRLSLAAFTALMLCAMGYAAAQVLPVADSLTTTPKTGERLSEWLVRSSGAQADTTALHWRVESERPPQRLLRDAALAGFPEAAISSTVVALRDAILALPITGRLPLYSTAQPLALQALPAQDPVLGDGHSIALFSRPKFVTLMVSSGEVCLVPHVPSLLARDYLNSCLSPADRAQTERVWLSQPDGRYADIGMAAWNQQAQTSLAPGAWLWVPLNRHHIAPETSSNLVRFLGTQAPLEHLPRSDLYQLARQLPPPVLSATKSPLDLAFSANDWGEVGLLQTPTARMRPLGDARFHLSSVWPYTRGTVMLQPLDWFEAGFRYTDIANRAYGPVELSGDQSYKDKSFDLKIRVVKESQWLPELAVGMRDIGGTGLFSGEYLVANKRWGDLDASLGMGWGYLGSGGNIRNPLSSLLGSKWDIRTVNSVSTGGSINEGGMFAGPVGVFGGIQYSASQKLLLKAELDGNSYQNEPQRNNQEVLSRLNVGVVYRQSPTLDWALGLERGNRVMTALTLHTDAKGLGGLYLSKPMDPPAPPLRLPETVGPLQISLNELLDQLYQQTGWQMRIVNLDGDTATVVADSATVVYIQDRIDRAVRTLNALLPPQYRRFVIQLREVAMPMATVLIERDEWVAQRMRAQPASSQLASQSIYPGNKSFKSFDDVSLPYAGGVFRVFPSFNQILGGPDAFLLYSLGLQLSGDYRINQSTWVVGGVNLRMLDNFDQFKYTAPSNLPRVRTYQREFVTSSALTLPQLQVTHMQELGGGHYASLYGGLLEPMYGGVGGEWFYRPWQSRWGVGVDVNRVRQRDFRQNLSFRDYEVSTGHAALYWDTGIQNLHATLSAGRYLAGDVGATIDVKKVFPNGVSLGAWVTKTNVSTEQFGEGSFDKGIYLTLPFDVILPRSSGGSASMAWNPLTRDGGARLSRRFTLDEITRLRSPALWRNKPAAPAETFTGANFSAIQTAEVQHPLSDPWQTTGNLGQQVAKLPVSTWLWAGGAVLASSLLDNTVDNWAQSNASGGWEKVGSVGNAMPYMLAAGVGLMYLGAAGEGEITTAETALRAGAYALVTNLGLRYMVGRARPTEDLGHASFDGFKSGATESGFPSNHTAIAFALVTPFAQQYGQPWLYAAAALTGYGRVQQRDHWLSDTVAGALLGYGIGSLLTVQQNKKGGPSLSVTPNAVTANWHF